jgi:hypothetical protein
MRIPPISRSSPARWHAPSQAREPEQVEEVWDAELVDELPAPGWLAVPALSAYGRAGFAMPPPLVDLRA